MVAQEIVGMSIKNIIREILSTCCDGNGISCTFWQVGDVGIKTYDNEYSRDSSFEKQFIGWENEIGPKPYFKFTFKTEDREWFCFVTELAELVTRTWWRFEKVRNGEYSQESLEKMQRELGDDIVDEVHELFEVAESLGWYYEDAHQDNVARLNGRLVFIDFGDESVES